MTTARTTTNHGQIRRWAEQRGGRPAIVKGTQRGEKPGILRIDFPGYSGEDTLEHVAWEDWFEVFDDSRLAFVHQDETADGKPSRFNKLVSRDERPER